MSNIIRYHEDSDSPGYEGDRLSVSGSGHAGQASTFPLWETKEQFTLNSCLVSSCACAHVGNLLDIISDYRRYWIAFRFSIS